MADIQVVDFNLIPQLPDDQDVGPTWGLAVGNPETGETWLIGEGRFQAAFLVPDLYGTMPPTGPGKERQKYFYNRTPTLVDLYQYEKGTWGPPRLVGIMLAGATPDASNTKPVVILAPVGTGTVGTLLALSATATSATSTIVKVEFFVGSQSVGVSTSTPYAATYAPTGTGTVYITAKATDANGQSTVSAAQPVPINAKGTTANLPPMVSITATPATLTVGTATTLNAVAADPDGPAPTVDFYDGATLIGTDSVSPYVLVYAPQTVGTHVITGKATDASGVSTIATTNVLATALVTPPTTVTPDPPAVQADDTANTLSFSSPLGTAAIVVSANNGPYTAYAGTLVVGNVARPLGYYKAKIKADTGRAESSFVESPAFTVTGGGVVVTPTAAITFGALPAKTMGDAPFALTATSTNPTTPLTYASSNTNVVTVALAGGTWTATLVGPGTATITASQAAGNGFLAAPAVGQSLTVNAAVVVTPTTYDNTVTGGNSLKDVTLGAVPADTLEFNNFAGADNSPITMEFWLAGTQEAAVPFAAYYLTKACRYTHSGTSYTKTFTAGRVDL